MKSKRSRKDRARRKCRFRVKLPTSDSIFKTGLLSSKPTIISTEDDFKLFGQESVLGFILRKLKYTKESLNISESDAYKLLFDEFKRQHGL